MLKVQPENVELFNSPDDEDVLDITTDWPAEGLVEFVWLTELTVFGEWVIVDVHGVLEAMTRSL